MSRKRIESLNYQTKWLLDASRRARTSFVVVLCIFEMCQLQCQRFLENHYINLIA
jgi:hypothetical protein